MPWRLPNHLYARIRRRLEKARGLDFASEDGSADPEETLVYRASTSGGPELEAALSDIRVAHGSRVLDVGCAKGGAMRTMTKFPFAAIDGIEIDLRLAEIARKNFRRLREPRVNVHCGDARDFEAYETYDLIYLYNPFPPVILETIVPKLSPASRILYNNPTGHRVLAAAGWRAGRQWPNAWPSGLIVEYQK